jgi:GNAT superfamily N-acetyltransferase
MVEVAVNLDLDKVSVDYRRMHGVYVDFKAYYEGEEIGRLQTDFREPGICCVLAVDVPERFQRQGIASLLYRHFRKYLEEVGCYDIRASAEGSGTVQLHEKTFGLGNTVYRQGDSELTYEEAIHVMDVDYGRLRIESKLCL